MNRIWVYFAQLAIKALIAALSKLTEQQLRDTAAIINKKVDMPYISEDMEGELIYGVLNGSVNVTIELLKNVKL